MIKKPMMGITMMTVRNRWTVDVPVDVAVDVYDTVVVGSWVVLKMRVAEMGKAVPPEVGKWQL